VIIKRIKTNERINPILELRVKGVQNKDGSIDDAASDSCTNSNASRIDGVDDFEEVANIIQNTFNTSAKYNKYKVNTHDFLMNQLSEIMNSNQEESISEANKGVTTQSIIQKWAKDSCKNLL
jgi:hypothetical protein